MKNFSSGIIFSPEGPAILMCAPSATSAGAVSEQLQQSARKFNLPVLATWPDLESGDGALAQRWGEKLASPDVVWLWKGIQPGAALSTRCVKRLPCTWSKTVAVRKAASLTTSLPHSPHSLRYRRKSKPIEKTVL
jgi:hypothetical protein